MVLSMKQGVKMESTLDWKLGVIFSEEMAFEQKNLKDDKKPATQRTGERGFQAERTTNTTSI